MCGIFAYVSRVNNTGVTHITSILKREFHKGRSRGPESSSFIKLNQKNIWFGFHRLAINGLNNESNQPFCISGVYLICNGEIYNYREIYDILKVNDFSFAPRSKSDCEVIIHIYLKYGIYYLLDILDGVFGFVLYDTNTNVMYVARDPYGVRPLYISKLNYLSGNIKNIIIASELKQLSNFEGSIDHVHPGTFITLILEHETDSIENITFEKYSSVGFSKKSFLYNSSRVHDFIYNSLYYAVKKRVLGTTERPIACLLSGGLDSSTITAMVNSFLPKGVLETYSIGLPGSTDLIYARKVADYLGTKHTEVLLTEDSFFDSIPEVIKVIESYDTTTVRASVGNYLVARYIRDNSVAKVIFNGDGSDEVTGGYKYFNFVKDPLEFDKECRRLLSDIYLFDVLRSDKSISSNGLEPRTPFLDRTFVQNYLSIPPEMRCHSLNKKCEKYLLRDAIEQVNPELLPSEVLWRTKEAFSDGVSGTERSWYQIIHEKLSTPDNTHIPKIELEKVYYHDIFQREYPGREGILPYYWMPKYINTDDPSARTI
jgi:asparagine synthase (glutamine-hydrolysing)